MRAKRARAAAPLDRETQATADASFDLALDGRGTWEMTVDEASRLTGMSPLMLRWHWRHGNISGRRIGTGDRGRLLLDVLSLTDHLRGRPPASKKRTGRTPNRKKGQDRA
jgi:hypothetical protein